VFAHQPFLKSLTDRPGIYQMYDSDRQILYVGKAKSLKKRIASYFRGKPAGKTAALVARIASIQVTITRTESEALILEQNLIKQQRPAYNLLLRDDKSYPYIFASDHPWPRLALHRGTKKRKGHYFGPFPNAQATREMLRLLQKVFRVRQCEDSFFQNRSRPCLQYQINRCTAPCVGLVDQKSYAQDLQHSIDLLAGRDQKLSRDLAAAMHAAAANLDFETAAQRRDQLQMLRTVQADQNIEKGSGHLDVVAAALDGDEGCVHMLYIRHGRIVGSRSFFPKVPLQTTAAALLGPFLAQHYLTGPPARVAPQILIGTPFSGRAALQQALQHHCDRAITIRQPQRGRGIQWLQTATQAAEQNLIGRQASKQSTRRRLHDLSHALDLDTDLKRLECYDISHTQGQETIGACVVFDLDGPRKKDYRRFNVAGITAGDDYAALEQVLRRRFTRLQKGAAPLPDLLVIDGGKGQLRRARELLTELAAPQVLTLAIAKGPARKAGHERFFLGDRPRELRLDPTRPGFHLLQHLRDEAHRFAITGHRARRSKRLADSPLQAIPGIGPRRRKKLVDHFGGYRGIESASQNDLARVEGISKPLAQTIYNHLHAP